MSYKNFEKALEKAKECKDYEIKGETSTEVVKKAEELFGYKLSRQNYEFFNKLGHMDLYGAEFYGIVKDDFSGTYTGCAIEATLKDRIDYNLPSEWLTIYDFDDGYMGYLDYSQLNENSEPPVIIAIYNGKEYVVSEKLAEDFGEFLLNFVEKHLANQEDNNKEEHLENQKLKINYGSPAPGRVE